MGRDPRPGDTADGHDILAAPTVRAPWLSVQGATDDALSAQDARARQPVGNESARFLLVDGANHTFGAQHPWVGSNPLLEHAVRASIDWFGGHLL